MGNFANVFRICVGGSEHFMGRKLSRQAVGILRATLEKVEQDPDLGEDNPAVSEFKRIVLNRVAEMEEPPFQATAKPPRTSAIGTALNLAAALVAEPAGKIDADPALRPVLDPALDPANHPVLVNGGEATPLLTQAAAESSIAASRGNPLSSETLLSDEQIS